MYFELISIKLFEIPIHLTLKSSVTTRLRFNRKYNHFDGTTWKEGATFMEFSRFKITNGGSSSECAMQHQSSQLISQVFCDCSAAETVA